MEPIQEPQHNPEPVSPMGALRPITPDAPWRWLLLGLQDMRRHPGPSLFYGACYTACSWAMGLALVKAYALFALLSTSFMLLGPMLAIGIYDISRRAESDSHIRLRPTLTAWCSNRGNLGLLAAILGVVLLIWARASVITFALFFEGGLPTFGEVVIAAVTFAQPLFTLIYLGVGAVFATLIYAIAVIAVPLMLDRKTDAITAGLTSILAVTRNPLPFSLWALIIAVLGVLSIATLGLGLVLAIPLLGHGTWRAYREVIDPDWQDGPPRNMPCQP